jgi:hypothetical protein
VVKQIIVCFVLVTLTCLGYVYFLMVSNWLTLQITAYIREGINQLSLSAYDAHDFCVGVRIFRRNSVKQVMDLIPAVTKGEDFEDALLRLRRCINGGGGGGSGVDDDDNDSDLEIITDSITVSLRCPVRLPCARA